MKKFSIRVFNSLNIYYNHYLSSKFIERKLSYYNDDFKQIYPLNYSSRGFDKPAVKWRDGVCFWKLDNKDHRIGKPAVIWVDGCVLYLENGMMVR